LTGNPAIVTHPRSLVAPSQKLQVYRPCLERLQPLQLRFCNT